MYKAEMIITNNNLPLIERLEPLMREALKKSLGEIGEILQGEAVKAIQTQTPPGDAVWPSLQEWYVKWKTRKGYSDQIYIMSSTYIQNITWKLAETPVDFQLVVGLMRSLGPGAEGNLPTWQVGQILEWGWEQFNTRIPPRPLWQPLLQTRKRSIQTRIGTAIYWSAKKIAAMAKGTVEGGS
jgi:hypothetical protein